MLYHSVFNYFNLFVYTLLFRVETCWWPGIIWSNANLCHKAGRRGKQFFFFLFGNIIWALESTIFKYRMSYFVSNRLVNKYTNKLYTCTPWLVTKASWVCVLWPWTKLTSLKMQKKNTLKQNKTTTMAKQTNKNTGPISCHLDRRNSVKKAFIMYVATPKFLLVRSKQNLF